MNEGSKRGIANFCGFHNYLGRKAEECYNLRNQTELLLRKWYLGEFVKKGVVMVGSSAGYAKIIHMIQKRQYEGGNMALRSDMKRLG